MMVLVTSRCDPGRRRSIHGVGFDSSLALEFLESNARAALGTRPGAHSWGYVSIRGLSIMRCWICC